MVTLKCKICKRKFKVYPSAIKYGRKYCSVECRIKSLFGHIGAGKGEKRPQFSGNKNPNWKGGRTKHATGYILVRQGYHPHRRKCDYILEHRLVMEKKLGRYLKPEEVVHHINGIKTDNRIENLVVMLKGKHHWSLVIKAMRKRIIELEKITARPRKQFLPK